MAYRLFLGEFKYIEKYLRKLRNDNDSLNDMYHSINLTAKKGKDTNYKIEEVDFITSGLSNEKEFVNMIKNEESSYLSSLEKSFDKLCLIRSNNNNYTNIPIIYNEELIYNKSIEKMDSNNNDYELELDEDLKKYINQIILMYGDKNFKDAMFNPGRITYLSSDLYSISKISIFKEYSYTNNPNITSLHVLLDNYINCKNEKNKRHILNADMGELDKEFIEAQKELYDFFRKYKNLRDLVGWEHGYYDILVKHINDENISDEHRKSIIEQIITLQEFRNERNDTQSYYDLSMLSSKYSYLLSEEKDTFDGIKEFKNPKLQQIYESDGLENIMEKVDLNEILTYDEDAEKLGIISRKGK